MLGKPVTRQAAKGVHFQPFPPQQTIVSVRAGCPSQGCIHELKSVLLRRWYISSDGNFVALSSDDALAGTTGVGAGSVNVFLWDRNGDSFTLVSHTSDSSAA